MLGKKDLRKLAREIGAELRYVTSIMRPFSGSGVLITKNNSRPVMYVVNYVSGKRVRTTVKPGSVAYRDIAGNIVLEAKAHILKENFDAIVAAGKSYTDYCDREVAARVKRKYPNMDIDLIYGVLDGSTKQLDYSGLRKDFVPDLFSISQNGVYAVFRGANNRNRPVLGMTDFVAGTTSDFEDDIFGYTAALHVQNDGTVVISAATGESASSYYQLIGQVGMTLDTFESAEEEPYSEGDQTTEG